VSGIEPKRDSGGIWVPKRAESTDGTVVGTGFVLLRPGDPDFAAWDRYLEADERRQRDPGRRAGGRRAEA
jgi:hypothetical protein